MECETAREAISAVLDGEQAGVLIEDLQEHLLGCAACRRWREAAHEVTRRARTAAAVSSRHTGEVVAAGLTSGLTSVGEEAPHLLAIVGWLLVRYLAAACPPTLDPPAPPARLRDWPLAERRSAGFRRRTMQRQEVEHQYLEEDLCEPEC
jgi:Putative zinc-finger